MKLGSHNATLKERLGNFRNKLADVMQLERLPELPASWTEAFEMLKKYSEPLLKKGKCVISWMNFPG